ncbi:hypothetical protein GCM10022381_20070 [Leifsonia kafniensis]|uniref:Uncharacterized protein n=1 Tax=Leifsonia kafniensis TaxID=475957 RepID=A0ABP7KIB8_9MICO
MLVLERTAALTSLRDLTELGIPGKSGAQRPGYRMTACDLTHVSLASFLDGWSWPDLDTIAT